MRNKLPQTGVLLFGLLPVLQLPGNGDGAVHLVFLVTQLPDAPVIEDGHLLIEEAFGGVGDFGQLDEVTPCQLMRQCRDNHG